MKLVDATLEDAVVGDKSTIYFRIRQEGDFVPFTYFYRFDESTMTPKQAAIVSAKNDANVESTESDWEIIKRLQVEK